ncbi:hypothetical protein BDW22DRAFT_301117 [Trametopsis cervina]|nr:hypothetical protein BDW22DRAFT_301117 [Trametopsis cervina]
MTFGGVDVIRNSSLRRTQILKRLLSPSYASHSLKSPHLENPSHLQRPSLIHDCQWLTADENYASSACYTCHKYNSPPPGHPQTVSSLSPPASSPSTRFRLYLWQLVSSASLLFICFRQSPRHGILSTMVNHHRRYILLSPRHPFIVDAARSTCTCTIVEHYYIHQDIIHTQ